MFLFSWFSKFLCKLRLFRDYSWVDKCNFHDFSKFIISVFENENWLVGGVLERIFTWRMHRYHHFFHMTRRLEMVWLWVFAFCGNLAHEFLRIKILWLWNVFLEKLRIFKFKKPIYRVFRCNCGIKNLYYSQTDHCSENLKWSACSPELDVFWGPLEFCPDEFTIIFWTFSQPHEIC